MHIKVDNGAYEEGKENEGKEKRNNISLRTNPVRITVLHSTVTVTHKLNHFLQLQAETLND